MSDLSGLYFLSAKHVPDPPGSPQLEAAHFHFYTLVWPTSSDSCSCKNTGKYSISQITNSTHFTYDNKICRAEYKADVYEIHNRSFWGLRIDMLTVLLN